VTDMVSTIYKWCDAVLTCLCRKSVVIDMVDTRKILTCLCRKSAVIDIVDTRKV
jgi:hypothetical protein